MPKRRLDHPVANRGNTQRATLLTPRLGDVMAADRLRTVGRAPQGVAEFLQFRLQSVPKHRDAHVVDPGRSRIGGDTSVRRVQNPFGMDLIHQAVPDPSCDPLIEGRQHPLGPDRRFDPSPSEDGLSGASSPFGHCLQGEFLRVGHRGSTSLHPFAPPALPGFPATMGALTPGRTALRLTHELRLENRPGLPVLCHRTFRTFRLQSPTAVPS